MGTRCHYEVLGIPLDADTQTLRNAYKKCALKWHPDKNLDDVEKAKTEFQLVQQAFEVLSDPHERAWYDAHREAILKGGIGKDYKDDSLNLFPYFSTSCYQGYGDDEKGFYAVYREVFSQIFAEDVDHDANEKPDSTIPNFGMSDSSYDEVVHRFYGYWENYCTTKTFVWLDEFDVREAPNRRVMRLMEKENKKVRDKARKQRNEEIRQLVRFVRKRDKRLGKHRKYLEEKAAENAMKVQMNRMRQLEERKREIAETTEADWAKMHNFESELKEIESTLATEFGDNTPDYENDDVDSMTEMTHLYCVACNKIFKNEKSFANHESSKKHKENVAALHIPIDDDLEDDDDQTYSNTDDERKQECSQQEAGAPSTKKKSKKKKVLKPMEEHHTNGVSGLDSVNESGADEEHITKSKKQAQKRNKKKNTKVPVETAKMECVELSNSESCDEDTQEPLQVAGKTDKVADKKQKQKKDADFQNVEEPEMESVEMLLPEIEVEDTLEPPKLDGKTDKGADKKRKKKKPANLQSKESNVEFKDLSLTCAVCNSVFPSKNKLFNHLKTTGHSVYLPKDAFAVEEKSKSRNRYSKC